MAQKTTLSISEARAKIYQIADQAEKFSQHFTLTENGRAKVVMISADEFEAWQETFAVAQEVSHLNKVIAEVKKDLKSGAYKKYKTIEQIIALSGYEPKQTKKVSSHS